MSLQAVYQNYRGTTASWSNMMLSAAGRDKFLRVIQYAVKLIAVRLESSHADSTWIAPLNAVAKYVGTATVPSEERTSALDSMRTTYRTDAYGCVRVRDGVRGCVGVPVMDVECFDWAPSLRRSSLHSRSRS